MKTKTIIRVCGFLAIMCLFLGCQSVLAYTEDEWSHDIAVNFEELSSLSDEELSRVVSVNAYKTLDGVEYSLLEKCTNLQSIYYSLVDNPDLSYLNEINLPDGVYMFFHASRVNIPAINNSSIEGISFSVSEVSGFKNLESLTQLESIGFGESSGYEQLDFSKFPNLAELALNVFIDDFDTLTANIPNVTSLSFGGSNIQNKDTVYLRRLTGLRELNLSQTYLTDVDFLEDLTNLENLTLPWSVQDLSPVYNLAKLTHLQWEAYTELFVTQELVDYLDSHNIGHPDYNPNINTKINEIIQALNLPDGFSDKEALSAMVDYIVENTQTDPLYDGITGAPSDLDLILIYGRGVCHHHSIAIYTLSKVLGIKDVYAVTGSLDKTVDYNIGKTDGDLLLVLVAHGWNLIMKDGRWYGIDAAQMNTNDGRVVNKDMNFWKNPIDDDEYDLNYAYSNYLDFNYYFAERHSETDGILNQKTTYQFENIDGLNIINHTIYEVDSSDRDASSICAKVLDNYGCQYVDDDNDGQISSGDKLRILHNSEIIDEFLLNVGSWTPPVEQWLGGLDTKYKNYPDVETNPLNTNYFSEGNPLFLVLNGRGYNEQQEYPATLSIIDTKKNEEIYHDDFELFGNDINNGIQIELEAFDAMVPKEKNSGADPGFGVAQYIITLSIDGVERIWGGDYVIGDKDEDTKEDTNKDDGAKENKNNSEDTKESTKEDKNTPKETEQKDDSSKASDSPRDDKEDDDEGIVIPNTSVDTTENPNTVDNVAIYIVLLATASAILFYRNRHC